LLLVVAITQVALFVSVTVHVGVPHLAYNDVTFFASPPNAIVVPLVLFAVHPINTLELVPVPFVMLQLLSQIGAVHVSAAYVQVMLPAFVPVAPPQVPVPLFLLMVMVLSATVKLYVAVALL
jgi:hypothetical protein